MFISTSRFERLAMICPRFVCKTLAAGVDVACCRDSGSLAPSSGVELEDSILGDVEKYRVDSEEEFTLRNTSV